MSVAFSYGCRKWLKSQLRRTETAVSGKPRCGLQAFEWLCGIFPNCLVKLTPSHSFSSNKLFMRWICKHIMSFTARNFFDIVCNAICVYEFAEPKPASCSNDEITVCIWSWYCLYICSTCVIYPIHFPNQSLNLQNCTDQQNNQYRMYASF